MADELETSRRSVYRDISALIGQRVPIRGEAGFGYVLEGGFDLPPLMLTTAEIEAAVLGAQWVAGHGDPDLARAAGDLIAKIEVILPGKMRPLVGDPSVQAVPAWTMPADGLDLAQTREWIRAGRKIRIDYHDQYEQESSRTIWPVTISYFDAARVLIAWCEFREDFRSFRVDRVGSPIFLDECFPVRPSTLRTRWLKRIVPEK